MKSTYGIIAAAALAIVRADDIPNCGVGLANCPEKYPCCSASGICGNGYVCLGGCDPRYSNTPGACMPMPICKNYNQSLTSTDQVSTFSNYMGDPSKNMFSYLGKIAAEDGKLRIVLDKDATGSTVYSSRYVWYGKTSIKMRTAGVSGMVNDFILMSDVKDEVDYELLGNNVNQGQTNYYWQGNLVYDLATYPTIDNTATNWHVYTIDWQQDKIDWIIDGVTVRTLTKESTFNSSSNTYAFPQTPSRVQFGLWPGGDSSAAGTSEWAGGKINWDVPAITGSPGYFFVEVDSVAVECYDAPSSAKSSGSNAYKWTDAKGLESSVEITDDSTVLESTDGTGVNPKGSLAGSGSASSQAAAVTLSNKLTTSTKSDGSVVTLSSALAKSSSESSSSAGSSAAGSGSAAGTAASTVASSAAGTAASRAASTSARTASAGSNSTAAATSANTGNAGSFLVPSLALLGVPAAFMLL